MSTRLNDSDSGFNMADNIIIAVNPFASEAVYRRISNWASPRTSALKPRLSVSSHNTDARQTIERLTLSSYSACVNTENLVIKPGSAQIDVNFVNLKFVYTRNFFPTACRTACKHAFCFLRVRPEAVSTRHSWLWQTLDDVYTHRCFSES